MGRAWRAFIIGEAYNIVIVISEAVITIGIQWFFPISFDYDHDHDHDHDFILDEIDFA